MSLINKDLEKYYTDNLKKHGFSAQGVGWKNETAQHRRFEQLIKIIEEDGFSINDLGCGSADFFLFLQDNTPFHDFTYTGYDSIEDMYIHAKDKYAAAKNASFYHISAMEQLKPADYTIASGIFNLKYSETNEKWLEYILTTIHSMNIASSKGFAFNMLTNYADKEFMKDHLYYSDPLYFFDFCKKNFSRDIALLHDYKEYDFTILVRK